MYIRFIYFFIFYAISQPAISQTNKVNYSSENSFINSNTSVSTNISGIINDYTPVLSLGICNNTIIVEDASAFGIGDTVLIIQMKGAEIETSNNSDYGNILNYNSSGNYEFNYVKSVIGNSVELLNVISRSYEIPNGRVQLVRVPYYNSANVNASLTCLQWDGAKGGVLVLNVRDTIFLNGPINVSGKGFRGGEGQNSNTSTLFCNRNAYVLSNLDVHSGRKGESIHELSLAMIKGKGSAANGGGGGMGHNSGGGGGSNSGEGGFGGYQLNNCNNPSLDNRGIGGKPLVYNNIVNKVFLGGGGGAGDADSYGVFKPTGGNGGGIIFLIGNVLVGNNALIQANGSDGLSCVYVTQNDCHDAMGGGGGGGAVVLDINTFSNNVSIEAKGGNGANMIGAVALGGRIGSGGGGGGGAILTTNNSLPVQVSTFLNGGANGVLTQDGNNSYGATPGASGINVFNLVLPIDNTLFEPNIDSVRINRNQTSCTSFQFNALGFTRSNPIINWEWSFGDGNTSVSPNPTHNYSSTGNYNVKLYGYDVNGCVDSFAVTLNIAQANVAASADQQFCSNGPVSTSVSANGNGTISWSPAVLFNNHASSTPTVTVSNTTKLYATSTLSPGCSARDSLTITVNPLPFTNLSQSICPAQLPYTWNSQNITSGGNYIALLSSAAGCDSTVSLNLTIEDTIRSFNQLTICSNQAPFNWNGQSLTTTGTYRAELTNTSNCDSVATLNLTINPISNSLSNETICSSQIPYSWNGQSITSSGNYQVVLMNSLGCDSIARLNLSLLPSSTSNSAQTICSNATPFNWNGQSFNSSGNYSVSLTAANGCDSTANLNLTVNPVRSSNTNASICSGALPYNWNGLTINSSGTYTSNLTSANGCDSIATLQLQVNSNVTSTTQRSICTAQLPYTWNGLTLNGPGSYTANLISQAGCDSLATIELQVGNSVTSSISEEICNSSFPYSWNGLNIQTPGNYNATLTSNNGCDSIVTLTLTVKPSPPFNTIPDTAICRGTTLRLTTSSGFTNYQWTPGNLVNDSTTSNPLYSGINPTQMLVVSAIDPIGGCLISDTVMVTNRPLPLVTATPDTAVCSNSPTVLSATGANTYQWSPPTYLGNPSVNNPVFSSSTGMVYIVSGSDNFGCIGKDTVAVSIRTPNNLAPPPDKAMCKGQQVELDGANGFNYQYVWSPASYLSNSNVINPIATPTATTTYTVTIKDLLCSYERNFEVDVTVYPLPNVSIQKSNNINCSQKTARLTASGASQYQWQPDPTLSSTSIRNPIASPTATTQYVVVGTDVRGCSNSDTITVTAMGVLEAYAIPNAFTPNGDGLNDCFGIRKWGDARNVYFAIYNRWGDLVFETRDMNECWDGNYKGKQANAGNYVFYVIADTPCGKMNKKGNVVLIR